MRSPVESSMSSSRGCGSGETWRASSTSPSVVSPIAETVATTRRPCSRASARRRATCLILSGSATEDPPNFMTTVSESGSGRALTARLWRSRRSRACSPLPSRRAARRSRRLRVPEPLGPLLRGRLHRHSLGRAGALRPRDDEAAREALPASSSSGRPARPRPLGARRARRALHVRRDSHQRTSSRRRGRPSTRTRRRSAAPWSPSPASPCSPGLTASRSSRRRSSRGSLPSVRRWQLPVLERVPLPARAGLTSHTGRRQREKTSSTSGRADRGTSTKRWSPGSMTVLPRGGIESSPRTTTAMIAVRGSPTSRTAAPAIAWSGATTKSMRSSSLSAPTSIGASRLAGTVTGGRAGRRPTRASCPAGSWIRGRRRRPR